MFDVFGYERGNGRGIGNVDDERGKVTTLALPRGQRKKETYEMWKIKI